MKSIAFFLLLMLFSIHTSGQRNPDEMVAIFFENYQKDKGMAMQEIYKTNPWIGRNEDAVANLIGEVEKLTPSYVGEYYGYSLICKKELAGCFVLQSYLVRHGRQPIRFTFEFYKPDKEWQLFSLGFDVSVNDELEEASKIYYLPLGN